jgi:AraC family transcriptional regulator of adaptative response / DNA-3-methyladenine glycosylase II
MSDFRWVRMRAAGNMDSMDFRQRYRIIESRDLRFDGQFFTAVRSTGIYCRPSCPARTPKAENVVFFQTSAAAHEAGFRACKRCLPEAVAGSPEWNLRSDVAGRAMRLIADGAVDRDGVAGLAAALGYSERQLNRILTSELGAGPLALARAARAQTARALLTETTLKFADVAFAAGFNSVRQFNDTVAEVFGLTPTELRARVRARTSAGSTTAGAEAPATGATTATPAQGGAAAGPPPATLHLSLPYREPFDPGIFDFLAARAVSGVEDADGTHYARVLALPHGHGAFDLRWTGKSLEVAATLEDLHDLPALLARLRRLFDLDADPGAIDAVLASDPAMAHRVNLIPGIRLPGSVDAAEILIRAMIGQQITVAAARTALNQLAVASTPSRLPDGTLVRLFPSPAQIAEHGRDILRGPRRRIEAVCGTAALLASGELRIGLQDDLESLTAKLLPLPGIGPWTVGYVAMRVLGSPDVFLANDAAVRNGLARLEGGAGSFAPAVGGAAGASGTPNNAVEYAEQFSPWRSYATMHLWRAAAEKAALPVRRRSPR